MGGTGLFLIGMAVLQAWPGRGFWQGTAHGQPGTLATMTSAMAPTPQPHVLSTWITAFTGFDEAHGFAVNLFVVAALAVTGAVFLTGRPRLIRPVLIGFTVLCLADWVLIEDFGFLGGLGTDPNSMIPMALIAIAGYLALTPSPVTAAEPAAAAPATNWRHRARLALDRARPANVRQSVAAASIESAASVGAIGLIVLGAVPMAVAQANPVADTILAQAINGSSDQVNYPAPGFSLTDQYGRNVTLPSLRGKVVLLTFLDDTCSVDCPLIAQEFRQAGQLLAADSRHVELVAINYNPINTGVSYIQAFDRQEGLDGVPNWLYLTGTPAQLQQVWHRYGVPLGNPARRVDDPARRLRLRPRPERPPAAGTQLRHRARNPGHQVIVRGRADRRRPPAPGALMRMPARPAATAVALAAAALIAGCGSATPAAPGPAAEAPPGGAPFLATSMVTAGGTWAVAVMGGSVASHNNFWQVFARPAGSSNWKLVTPPGTPDNGGLVLADAGQSLITGLRPSQYLTYTPLTITADGGHAWSSAGPLDAALADVPDALAAAPRTGQLLALTADGTAELAAPGYTSWKALATRRALAATPAGRTCGLQALTAAAYSPAGSRCSRHMLRAGNRGHLRIR